MVGKKVLPKTTLRDRIGRFAEEARELLELKNSADKISIAKEAGDCIIICLSILDHTGIDAERIFREIMTTNHYKYNVVINGRLQEEGMTQEEAMFHQKQEWR